MKATLLLLTLVSLASLTIVVSCTSRVTFHESPPRLTFRPLEKGILSDNDDVAPFEEKYFDVDIDHFNLRAREESSGTYPMRYLINQDNWNRKNNGPILFYCGNEGDITGFWKNTGFQTKTLAQEFGGVVIFAEHRYFGESLPFGKKSFEKENLGYLSAEQALSDFVVLIRALKNKILNCPDCPVITFGGSYGGMLAAWMRMKFPNVVDGAISSSAPLIYFNGVTPYEGFFEIATSSYKQTSTPHCADLISEGVRRAYKIKSNFTQEGVKRLNSIFTPCSQFTKAENVTTLLDWLFNAYAYMAMVDYPYETNFLTHMPGSPVDYACRSFKNLTVNSSDDQIFAAMHSAARVFYDYDNRTTCNQVNSSDNAGNIDGDGWNILACGAMVLPMSALGPKSNDMFPSAPWDFANYARNCRSTYNLQTKYTWALDFFGGWDYMVDFQGYSNIFFSNGKRDPWSAGGVLKNVSESVKAFYMEGAAHHLDLRSPHPKDPHDVVIGRDMERAEIKKWIQQKREKLSKVQKTNKSMDEKVIVGPVHSTFWRRFHRLHKSGPRTH